MIAATLTILFVFSGVFAIATIAGSVRRHGAAALAIGQTLRTIGDSREVSVITRRIDVRATARVLRPDFRSPDFRDSASRPQRALPAAA